jgi:hypothetical protein
MDGINFPHGDSLITTQPEYVVYLGASQIKRHAGRMCRYCKMDLDKNPHYIKHANHDNGCRNCFARATEQGTATGA